MRNWPQVSWVSQRGSTQALFHPPSSLEAASHGLGVPWPLLAVLQRDSVVQVVRKVSFLRVCFAVNWDEWAGSSNRLDQGLGLGRDEDHCRSERRLMKRSWASPHGA